MSAKCCICGKELVGGSLAIFFVGSNGDEKQLCEECKKQSDLFFHGEDEENAVEYFMSHVDMITDMEVQRFIDSYMGKGQYDQGDIQKQQSAIKAQSPKDTASNSVDCDSAMNRKNNMSGSNIHWGRLIGIGAVVIFIIYVLIAGSSNSTTSYYMDYNGNGNMDKGEWVWDEDSSGNTIDFDWNGDGLYDWQD